MILNYAMNKWFAFANQARLAAIAVIGQKFSP